MHTTAVFCLELRVSLVGLGHRRMPDFAFISQGPFAISLLGYSSFWPRHTVSKHAPGINRGSICSHLITYQSAKRGRGGAPV